MYLLLVFALLGIGASLMFFAWHSKKVVDQTLEDVYQMTPMEVVHVNIIPNYFYGDVPVGPLTEKTSAVLVKYRYVFGGHTYEGRRIFPLEIECAKPRISTFTLFEQIKSGQLNHCFVDASMPTRSVLFRGWSPYLKSHVMGVFFSGVIVFVCGVAFYQIV